MLLKAITKMADGEETTEAGTIFERPDVVGRELIGNGLAVEVRTPAPLLSADLAGHVSSVDRMTEEEAAAQREVRAAAVPSNKMAPGLKNKVLTRR